MELRGQKGEFSCHTTPCSPLPNRKTPILSYTSRRKEHFLPEAAAQPMRDCHNSINERPLHFKLPIYSNGLFVYNNPYQRPTSSKKKKKAVLFFVLQACLWFCHSLHVPNCNSVIPE